ncbi:hypothetical protein ACFQ0B_24785 [Nonomuraea thailandensis]
MRLGVLDIGSHAAHLRIADLTAGYPPQPVATLKRQIRLAEAISRDGVIGRAGIDRLTEAVRRPPPSRPSTGCTSWCRTPPPWCVTPPTATRS